MADLVPGYGPQGYIPSGESRGQVETAEQKLQKMMEAMGGASNSVLMMIARILGRDQAAPAPQPQEDWQRLYPMPQPTMEGINGNFIRPSVPPANVPAAPWGGGVRGAVEGILDSIIPTAQAAEPRKGPTPPGPQYVVIDASGARVAGPYGTLKRASHAADKRDLDYGAVRHRVVPLGK